jgi:hypothetical protein
MPRVVRILQEICPDQQLLTCLPSPRRTVPGFTLSFPGRIDNTLKKFRRQGSGICADQSTIRHNAQGTIAG